MVQRTGAATSRSAETAAEGASAAEPYARLFMEYRRGDPAALLAIHSRFDRSLLRFVYHHTHDWGRAEDVCQETWLKVMTKAQSFDGEKTFSSWLFRIARNEAASAYRHNQHDWNSFSLDTPLPSRSGEGEETHATFVVGREKDPAEQVVQDESLRRVQAVLPRLNSQDRRYIELHIVEGRKLQDVEPGTSLSVAKGRMDRARHSLQVTLGTGTTPDQRRESEMRQQRAAAKEQIEAHKRQLGYDVHRVLVHHLVNGLPIDEIAHRMNCSQHTVRKNLNIGLQVLNSAKN